jgi:hypothetical protein
VNAKGISWIQQTSWCIASLQRMKHVNDCPVQEEKKGGYWSNDNILKNGNRIQVFRGFLTSGKMTREISCILHGKLHVFCMENYMYCTLKFLCTGPRILTGKFGRLWTEMQCNLCQNSTRLRESGMCSVSYLSAYGTGKFSRELHWISVQITGKLSAEELGTFGVQNRKDRFTRHEIFYYATT